jgi:hypothetical protein
MHPAVQVTELRGQARVALDHAEPVAAAVVEELEVEEAAVKPIAPRKRRATSSARACTSALPAGWAAPSA